MSDETPAAPPAPDRTITTDPAVIARIRVLQDTIRALFVEARVDMPTGTSALASLLITTLVAAMAQGNTEARTVARRIASRLQLLADAPPELVQAESQALADGRRPS